MLSEWQVHKSFGGQSIEKEMSYHFFVQYHPYRQLGELRRKAHALGIILKGDLPIGVGRNSEDIRALSAPLSAWIRKRVLLQMPSDVGQRLGISYI